MKVFVAILALALVAQAAPVDWKNVVVMERMFRLGKVVAEQTNNLVRAIMHHPDKITCIESVGVKYEKILTEVGTQFKRCIDQTNDKGVAELCCDEHAGPAIDKVCEASRVALVCINGF